MSDSILNPTQAPLPVMSDHPDFGRMSGLEQRLPLVKETAPPALPLTSSAAPLAEKPAVTPHAERVPTPVVSSSATVDQRILIADLRARLLGQIQDVLPLTQVAAGADDFEMAVSRAREWSAIYRGLRAVYDQMTLLTDDVEL